MRNEPGAAGAGKRSPDLRAWVTAVTLPDVGVP